MRRLTVAITGASGAVYGREFCRFLAGASLGVDLVVSDNGAKVIRHELGLTEISPAALAGGPAGNFRLWDNHDLAAGPSSGSYPSDAMVVIPASGHAIAGIAHGFSDTLVIRAALVALKQKRPLIVVPRETPLGVIELRNQLLLAEAGAVVLPAMPGFYQKPQTVDDLVRFVVAKVAEVLGLPHDLYRRWTGEELAAKS